MTEPDRKRVVPSAPRLSPDEIAARAFPSKVRGYAEPEVRTFLERVAEEVAGARRREDDLLADIARLEEQLDAPRSLTEKELLDGLGEETARLLRSAHDAGDELRRKATDEAEAIVEAARVEATRLVDEAEARAASVTQDADTRAARVTAAADARAAEVAERALADGEQVREQVKAQGREMLEEAKAARARVLGDLVRRRAALLAQVEELRAGRDHLLEAYRVVRRTLGEATDALEGAEARAAAELPAHVANVDVGSEVAAEVAALERGEGTVPTEIADVDSLFARLRAGTEGTTADAVPTAPPTPVDPALALPAPTAEAAVAWRAGCTTAVEALRGPLLKRTKRTIQDEQNALLDAVRRHRGRPAADAVLPPADDAITAWSVVLAEAVGAAYGRGREAAGGREADVDAALVRAVAEQIIGPLRQRVTDAIDGAESADAGGLAERIGARYREWRSGALEDALTDGLTAAWSRGVADASPPGAVLWWVPTPEGCCTDCADDALQPVRKGSPFPTGRTAPPAHPGCRCVLGPAATLSPVPSA